jgi:hypothetical protein
MGATKGNAMTEPSHPVPPPPGAAPQPAKKGMGPLGWILIGCGVIAVLGVLVVGGMVAAGGWFFKKQVDKFEKNPTLTAAEWAVRANPDLEIVSKDEKEGTITVKNKKTGEVVTMGADEAKEGRWTFKSDQGTATVDASGKEGIKVTTGKGEVATFGAGAPQNLPSWLPVYPGGTVQGTIDTTNAEGRSATFTVNTKDPATKVLDYYEAELKAAGFKTDKTTFSTNDQTAGGTVTATTEDQKRQVNIMVSTSEEGTGAIVSFQEKK